MSALSTQDLHEPATITPEVREQLILEHLPQVKLIARRIHERLPNSVSLDDLLSTGIVGLIAAIDRYDASHHVKLKTYAEYKIRGAILDSLRDLDWAPRLQRKRAKQIEAAIAQLEQELKRMPSENEIAEHLQISLADYHEWLSSAHGLTLGSFEQAGGDEENRNILRYISDSEENWPSQIFEREELSRILTDAITSLPYIEKTILSLYYYEEMTLREIALIAGLHESRISQLKSQAVLRLRVTIQRKWPTEHGGA